MKVTCCEFCSCRIKIKSKLWIFFVGYTLVESKSKVFMLLYCALSSYWIIFKKKIVMHRTIVKLYIFSFLCYVLSSYSIQSFFVFVLHIKLLLNPKSKLVLKAINYSIHVIHSVNILLTSNPLHSYSKKIKLFLVCDERWGLGFLM